LTSIQKRWIMEIRLLVGFDSSDEPIYF